MSRVVSLSIVFIARLAMVTINVFPTCMSPRSFFICVYDTMTVYRVTIKCSGYSICYQDGNRHDGASRECGSLPVRRTWFSIVE